MIDKDKLLELVRRQPKNDAARLVCADWLEENLGLEHWPRLIRAQIQQQGEWKYEAWNCSSAAAFEMGLDKLGTLGQYDYDVRRKDVRVTVAYNNDFPDDRYDIVLSRGFPRQLIYKDDLKPFVKHAAKLFKWPIVSVLTAAEPDEADPTPESEFDTHISYDWWTDRADAVDPGSYRLPHELFEKLRDLYGPGPGVHPEELDAAGDLVRYIEFQDSEDAVYALKRAIMAYGRQAYKDSLKQPCKKG